MSEGSPGAVANAKVEHHHRSDGGTTFALATLPSLIMAIAIVLAGAAKARAQGSRRPVSSGARGLHNWVPSERRARSGSPRAAPARPPLPGRGNQRRGASARIVGARFRPEALQRFPAGSVDSDTGGWFATRLGSSRLPSKRGSRSAALIFSAPMIMALRKRPWITPLLLPDRARLQSSATKSHAMTRKPRLHAASSKRGWSARSMPPNSPRGRMTASTESWISVMR